MTNRRFKEIIEKIVISPIFISFFVFIIAAVIVYKLTISKVQEAYNDIFIRDVLVEAHGMLFDILIIGTFIFALHELVEKRRERKSKIKRWQDEIDDFRDWDEKEAMFRIVGNIKRLNRYGVTDIYLRDCFLKGANLRAANLNGANLRAANLNEASLAEANLWEADLSGADLSGADLMIANLIEADISGTSLAEAHLWKADLRKADLRRADLREADFGEADLRGAKLTIEQLSNVKTLFQTILDSELKKEIKQKYPHLLEMQGFPKERVEK